VSAVRVGEAVEERGASSGAPVRIQVGRVVTIQEYMWGTSAQSALACNTGGGAPSRRSGRGQAWEWCGWAAALNRRGIQHTLRYSRGV